MAAPIWQRSLSWIAYIAVMAILVAGYLWWDYRVGLPQGSVATYVGRDTCVRCHQNQSKLFEGSHHDLAMDRATDSTVLGDFSGVELEHYGIRSRMYRDGEKYMVRTEGPDGALTDFEVKYVFGVEPLQQYMVEFDRKPQQPATEEARLQVLRISWDTEAKRWFYLDPPDVREKLAPDDELHWTGVGQRWNNMCADCHSTNLQKRFDVATAEYHTSFSEIDVSCETCHGPGSLHVSLAESRSLFWDRDRGFALAKLKETPDQQIQSCAPCHARRQGIQPGYEGGKPYFDHYADELLVEGIYYADGQVLDEDYIHGSFLQSKMYHKGIKCSDCHDPHTARLKHDGNLVCTSCHQHPAANYDSPRHHFHQVGSAGAQCVNCHMMSTTYMAVDERHDHSFRIPRPDLSMKIESPNACASCHLDKGMLSEEKRKSLPLYQDWMQAARDGDQDVKRALQQVNQWCDQACDKWYGEKRYRGKHFGEALFAARERSANCVEEIRWLLEGEGPQFPAIARATALRESIRLGPETSASLGRPSLDDPHPLVRAAAAAAHEGLTDANSLQRRLSPLLDDPVRLVRAEAARVLAAAGIREVTGGKSESYRKALSEWRAGVEADSDRAAAHLTLGSIDEQLGRDTEAEQRYRTAMRIEPRVTGPRTNLAALLEQRIARAQQNQATITQEVALALQNEIDKLRQEELPLLLRDADLLPNNAQLQYRAGLALYLADRNAEAEVRLEKAVDLDNNEPNFLLALALLYEQQKRQAEAIPLMERLMKIAPNETNQALLDRLKAP